MSIPILGGAAQVGGGQEYAVELHAVDGTRYVHVMRFELPTGGADGAADLGALKDFNPEQQAVGMLQAFLCVVQGMPVNLPPGVKVTPVLPCEGGYRVSLAHVVSLRWLGAVTRQDDTVYGPVLRNAETGALVWHRILDGGAPWE